MRASTTQHCWVLLFILRVVLVWQSPSLVEGHSRWACPKPRNVDTGIKFGPCGSETDNFETAASVIEIAPGPMLVQWEESIAHTGAPFRISLSQDGSDGSPCVLVDHIPHNDDSSPNFGDESTYTLYSLTIDIPDVLCERCSLHLANMMTDKIGDLGSPTNVGCTDPDGTCFSVYHSCTIPIKITGSMTRNAYQCPGPPPNTDSTDWPTSWIGDGGVSVDANVPGVYHRESAMWDNGFLLDAPEQYRQINAGDLCSSGATTTITPSAAPNLEESVSSFIARLEARIRDFLALVRKILRL